MLHVGRVADVPMHNGWLSARELRVFGRLRLAPRRQQWRLGRWTAKQALRQVVAGALSDVRRLEIIAAADGAPEAFLDQRPLPVSISITHRDAVSACLVGPRSVELGCDLERVEPRTDLFVQDFFTEDEQAMVWNTEPSLRDALKVLIWSAKESALKVARTGLRRDTRSVAVIVNDLDDPAPATWRTLGVRDIERAVTMTGWWCRRDELVLTVVVRGGPKVPPRLVDSGEVEPPRGR